MPAYFSLLYIHNVKLINATLLNW